VYHPEGLTLHESPDERRLPFEFAESTPMAGRFVVTGWLGGERFAVVTEEVPTAGLGDGLYVGFPASRTPSSWPNEPVLLPHFYDLVASLCLRRPAEHGTAGQWRARGPVAHPLDRLHTLVGPQVFPARLPASRRPGR